MAEAIFSGMLSTKKVGCENITVGDIDTARLEQLHKTYGIAVLSTAEAAGYGKLAQGCDILFLAIKPQVARKVLQQVAKVISPDTLVVSIMGGISIAMLENQLPENPVVRVMPNTPMLVECGAAGIAGGSRAGAEDVSLCKEIFDLVGISYIVDEKAIDALTGISGCGPAFVYMFIEAMADAGVEQGLPRAMAVTLAAQAVKGAAEMVLKTGKHPGQLKDDVTSPGGGTIAGVHALEKGGMRASVMDAVEAGCRRMKQVGEDA